MAGTKGSGSDSFSVHGKIFDEATRNGIENLQVTVYDVGRGDDYAADGKIADLLARSTRIGSVLSDGSGAPAPQAPGLTLAQVTVREVAQLGPRVNARRAEVPTRV